MSEDRFAAFLSHYKIEAATEARWLQGELEALLGTRCFLDSDDLNLLTDLKDHVRSSNCLLLLQTKGVLSRPWCIVELMTAIEHSVPIVGVSITSGTAPYDFAAALDFMTHFDTLLDVEKQGQLAALKVDLTDVAFKLSNTLPHIISVALNMNESRAKLRATLEDIVNAMSNAKLPVLSADRAAWLTTRGQAMRPPQHGPASTGSASFRSVITGPALASLPLEVPSLPDGFVARNDMISAMKRTVLHGTDAKAMAVTAPAKKAHGMNNTTTTQGMGGVGKTTITAALVHDDEVRGAFKTICWIAVGQVPDVPELQRKLYLQLAKQPLPEAAKADPQIALDLLKEAAKDVPVLLVLDDVWHASDAKFLNFVDRSAKHSAVVVTTRMRTLLEGAAEVQCGTLSREASLELLLRTGGCDSLLEAPPPAATEAIELCGRLPLTLSIAGGIITSLGTGWEAEICELLKDEFEEASVEERVVTASLRILPEATRAGVEGLFTLFAVFAEDAVIPAATVDLLAPLMPADASIKNAAHKKMQVRKWLQQLLKANLIKGSIEDGVSVHDLVRDCMTHRAEREGKGGLCAMQRAAMHLLLGAFDASGPVASYTTASLHWHVRQAQQPDVAIHADTLLMRVLTHESADVRKQGAIGIGVDKLRSEADACGAAGKHMEAARLMWASCAVRGSAAGAEAKHAWASFQQLEAAGGGSAASRSLEIQVLNALVLSTDGGFAFGSAEHTAVMARIKELGKGKSRTVDGGEGDAVAPSKEVMEAELGVGMAAVMAAFAIEGITSYPGPMMDEMLVQAHGHLSECAAQYAKAAAAAPDATTALVMWSYFAYPVISCPRRHILPDFSPEAIVGEGGKRLRETIEQYNFRSMHPIAKQVGMCADFFAFTYEPLGLLLWFGNLKSARLGFAKSLEVNQRILARIRQGEATADVYCYEWFNMFCCLPAALLAAGELGSLRDFLEHSPIHATLDDEAFSKMYFQAILPEAYGWKTDDGHCMSSSQTHLLVLHGLLALLEEDTNASRAALRQWLPPPAELLRITEYECIWRAYCMGANHPALLLARLRGERLGEWEAAAEVAEGVLAIEAFNPLLRTEACRLLGRARHALGARVAACEAAEMAVVEAARARYAWLEMMSLRDLLSWCGVGEGETVCLRLRAVAGRLAASQEELVGVLGAGTWV